MKAVSITKKIDQTDIDKYAVLPIYNKDIDYIRNLKSNKKITIEYKKPRNPDHHALIFALARCTIDNLPDSSLWNNKKPYDLIKAIQLEIGDVENQLTLSGELVQLPKSLRFENMSEDEFEIISGAIFEVCAKMLKITKDDLQKNYMRYL